MSITLGRTTFDHVDYDADADVLYLHVGDPSSAVDFDESPDGHALRFDAEGRLVGIPAVGVRDATLRDGRLVITVPNRLEVDPSELAAIIDAGLSASRKPRSAER